MGALRQRVFLYVLQYGPFNALGKSVFESGIDTSKPIGNVRVICGSEDDLQCYHSPQFPDSVTVLSGTWHGGVLWYLSGFDDT
jgi:hypothetical protein